VGDTVQPADGGAGAVQCRQDGLLHCAGGGRCCCFDRNAVSLMVQCFWFLGMFWKAFRLRQVFQKLGSALLSIWGILWGASDGLYCRSFGGFGCCFGDGEGMQ
jgi:hypothetical protein